MAKAKIPTDEKFEKIDFDLFEALAAIDRKDYGYYDRLTDEQKKKFAPFMLIKWMSSVKSSFPVQQFHVLSTNEFANKHIFNEIVSKHPKLQWLMLCASGLDNGKQFHQFIKTNKDKNEDSILDFLSKTYPDLKISDLQTLSKLISMEEIEKYIHDSGN